MRLIKGVLDYTGYLTVFVLWTSILLAITKSGFSLFGTKPLSSLGVMSESDFYFSGGLFIAAILFVLFTVHLRNKFVVTCAFFITVFLGQIGQIISAFVPFGGAQPARAVHSFAAFGLAISIPLALLFFAKSQPEGRFRKISFNLFFVELVAFVIGIGLFVLSLAAAYAQVLPAVALHMWIIYVNKAYLAKV